MVKKLVSPASVSDPAPDGAEAVPSPTTAKCSIHRARGRFRRSSKGAPHAVNGARDASRSKVSERGYTLAFLMVVVTVMNIAVAMALPQWSTFVQREKEAELIFRGLQYAEAIRVFQKTNNRLPITLEELYEREPRSIRQLYADPMTEGGKWGLLVQTSAQAPQNPQNTRGNDPNAVRGVGVGGRRPNNDVSGGGDSNRPVGVGVGDAGSPSRGGGGGQGGVVAVPPAPQGESSSGFGEPIQRTTGPIVGVYSAAEGKALRKFMNSDSYNQWQFKTDLIPVPAILGGDQPAPRVTSEWIGKPFREDLQVPQAGRGGPGAARELVGGSAPGQGGQFGQQGDQRNPEKNLRPGSFRPSRNN